MLWLLISLESAKLHGARMNWKVRGDYGVSKEREETLAFTTSADSRLSEIIPYFTLIKSRSFRNNDRLYSRIITRG